MSDAVGDEVRVESGARWVVARHRRGGRSGGLLRCQVAAGDSFCPKLPDVRVGGRSDEIRPAQSSIEEARALSREHGCSEWDISYVTASTDRADARDRIEELNASLREDSREDSASLEERWEW